MLRFNRLLVTDAQQQVRMAEELIATVHEPDDEIKAAWDEEMRIRIADIDAGTA